VYLFDESLMNHLCIINMQNDSKAKMPYHIVVCDIDRILMSLSLTCEFTQISKD